MDTYPHIDLLITKLITHQLYVYMRILFSLNWTYHFHVFSAVLFEYAIYHFDVTTDMLFEQDVSHFHVTSTISFEQDFYHFYINSTCCLKK